MSTFDFALTDSSGFDIRLNPLTRYLEPCHLYGQEGSYFHGGVEVTFSPSKDTYLYFDTVEQKWIKVEESLGSSAVTIDVPGNWEIGWKVITDAVQVTSVTDLRNFSPLSGSNIDEYYFRDGSRSFFALLPASSGRWAASVPTAQLDFVGSSPYLSSNPAHIASGVGLAGDTSVHFPVDLPSGVVVNRLYVYAFTGVSGDLKLSLWRRLLSTGTLTEMTSSEYSVPVLSSSPYGSSSVAIPSTYATIDRSKYQYFAVAKFKAGTSSLLFALELTYSSDRLRM